ncbi:MAG TPA: hypothetical protein VK577_20975, partial [Bradyrhizobium sp.]|nr:hypothetical protein [Bradyrhizobium sp.]
PMDVAHTVRNLCVPTWCRVLLAPRLPPGAAGDSGRVLVSLGTKDQARRIGAELTMMSEELFEQAK